jgi:hypothetical protein
MYVSKIKIRIFKRIQLVDGLQWQYESEKMLRKREGEATEKAHNSYINETVISRWIASWRRIRIS